MMPLSCATSSASAICRAMASASIERQPATCRARSTLARACRASVSPSTSSRIRKRMPSRFLEAVDRADVGMVQRREHPRLALEAREPIRVARERARQDLDRDVAPELRVARAVHLAHAARAEQRLQLIAAERCAGHGRGRRRRRPAAPASTSAGSARKPSSDADSVEQRFDVAPQRLVIGAGLGEKRRAIGRRPGARLVIQLLDPLPAFRRHASDRRASRASARPSPAASRPSPSRATPSGRRLFPRRSTRRRTASRSRGSSARRTSPAPRAHRRARRSPCAGSSVTTSASSKVTLRRVAAALLIVPRARVVHEDAAHHPRGHGEEMRAVVPRDRLAVDQADDRPR